MSRGRNRELIWVTTLSELSATLVLYYAGMSHGTD
jgi:hypothetical protein